MWVFFLPISFFSHSTQVLAMVQSFARSSAVAAAIHELIGEEQVLNVDVKESVYKAGNLFFCLFPGKLYGILKRMWSLKSSRF